MPKLSIRKFKSKKVCADDKRTLRAYKIVQYSHESASALHEAFSVLKGKRRGAATDEEQDVLRAMLISAGAGLDSTLKQLFRDCLNPLLYVESVQKGFEKFIERSLRKGSAESGINTELIAQSLAKPLPIIYLAERYVYDLTGSSLQSADQLFSACSALGIDPIKDAKLNKASLKTIFDTRNMIVHELDIDFSGARRNRIQRPLKNMLDMTNTLLHISQNFVELVHAKLPPTIDAEGIKTKKINKKKTSKKKPSH